MFDGEVDGKMSPKQNGWRTYITVGHDNEYDDTIPGGIRNFYVFTEMMQQIWMNEVEHLLSLPVPVQKEAKSIIFLTHNDWRNIQGDPDTGPMADSLFILDLESEGYNVTVPLYEDFTTIGPEQIAQLNMADLVILGRGIGSGDFDDADDAAWAELRKPIILMSNWTARAKRLGWVGSHSLPSMARVDSFNAKIEMPDDPIFNNILLPDDMIIPYALENLGAILAGKDLINGEVVLSLAASDKMVYNVDQETGTVTEDTVLSAYEGNLLLARWEPGVPMFAGDVEGKVAPVQQGYRTYITVGHDNAYDDALPGGIRNFYVFTCYMQRIWLNEVERLLSLPVPEPEEAKKVLFVTNQNWRHFVTEPETGPYGDSLHVAALINAGYDVWLTPHYETWGTIGEAQMDTLLAVDLVVLGRGISSGDFDDPDDEIWERLGTPILLMSNWTARAKRLGWMPSNSLTSMARVADFPATVEKPDDAVFAGLPVPDDNVIPYAKDDLGVVLSSADQINGEVLLSLAASNQMVYNVDQETGVVTEDTVLSAYAGNPLFVRWAPKTPMYEGEIDGVAAAVPNGYRTYLTVGHDNEYDDEAGVGIRNFGVFTNVAEDIYLNEVARLVHLKLETPPPTSVEDNVGQAPLTFELQQNYPNPFNPATTIEFSLAQSAHTTLTIYNVRGQIVATLVDQKLDSGVYSMQFDASQYSTGVYFYKLHAGNFMKINKMMLIK